VANATASRLVDENMLKRMILILRERV
jgi:hypothetical protein